LLPDEAPVVEGAELTWYYQPCDELGGDALNIFVLDDRLLALHVLDVSGHGVPSALLSVSVGHRLSQMFARRGEGNEMGNELDDPARLARKLNVLFPMDSKARLYFTVVYGVLNTRSRESRFVSAGSLDQSVASLVDAVVEWRGAPDLSDDATIVACAIRSRSPSPGCPTITRRQQTGNPPVGHGRPFGLRYV
jgi:hypothetical protein